MSLEESSLLIKDVSEIMKKKQQKNKNVVIRYIR